MASGLLCLACSSTISNPNRLFDECWNAHLGRWSSFCKQKQSIIWNAHDSLSPTAASKAHSPEARQSSSLRKSAAYQQESNRWKGRKGGLRRVITIQRSEGKWLDSWASEHATSVIELGLSDLAGDTSQGMKPRSQHVGVTLKIHKTGCGFFVKGQVAASVFRRCCGCSVTFMRRVDAPFQAWLAPTKDSRSHPQGIGEDNDDPTVLFFPPSEETADITELVRDTLHLSISTKDTCSNTCANIGPRKWHFSEKEMDSSWLPLLAVKSKQECK